MIKEYLRAFVIGSCFFVVIPFYYIVYNFNSNISNINYNKYIFYAPLWLGLCNVLSLLISKKLKLDRRQRYLTISLLAPAIVTITIIFFKTYNYTTAQWIRHIFILYLFYLFIFNCVVYLLDKYI